MQAYNKEIPIVYYHSVGPPDPRWTRNYLRLDPAYFEDQLNFFSRNFNVITLKDYREVVNGLKSPVENALVITFDDGYLDNWVRVFPLLKKYGLCATVFVSPEMVDLKNGIRPNLEDVWSGNISLNELPVSGFLSWEEMRLMEGSGLINIQSHTMSHTKYFVSDILTGFHHPGSDSFYPIGNIYPECKPYYITDPEYHKLIPFGYPFFEEKSAVVARKVTINDEFINKCCELLSDYNFNDYSFSAVKRIIELLYREYSERGNLISNIESEEIYLTRLNYEISGSKTAIENALGKKVEFLCWSHGDNSHEAHELALKAGYLATTWGKLQPDNRDLTRIPQRIGTNAFYNNRFLTIKRAEYKIKSYTGRFPYYQIDYLYKKIRY